MKQSHKTRFLCLGVAGLLLLSLAGCSSGATVSVSESASQSVVEAAQGKTVVGKVTAVSGDVVTLQLGTLEQGGGAAPQKPEGDSGMAEPPADGSMPEGGPGGDGTAPQKPEDGASMAEPPADGSMAEPPADTSMPEGGAGGPGAGGSRFTAGADTLDITLLETTEILLSEQGKTSAGTADDITVDSIVSVESDDSGVILRITVYQDVSAAAVQ